MSIYDRGYMNDENDGPYGDPARRKYSAITVLIIINTLVWIAWQFGRNEGPMQAFMSQHFLVWPAEVIDHFHWHTLLTSTISHIDIGHIFFNMLFLWFLGQDVERIYGHRNFYCLYVFCGIVASLAHVGLGFAEQDGTPALGASGAIMGIAVVAAIFDPDRPINLYGIIPIKLKWLVGIYVFIDLMGVVQPQGGGVARAAHLGGALAGAIFYKLDLRIFGAPGRRNVGWWHRVRGWFRRRPRLRIVEKSIPQEIPREAVAQSRSSGRGTASAGAAARARQHSVDAATASRVDQLLAKISSEGMGALTDEERAFLKTSSEKYKR
jgi:membrane associated rhomboid family serine protease